MTVFHRLNAHNEMTTTFLYSEDHMYTQGIQETGAHVRKEHSRTTTWPYDDIYTLQVLQQLT